MASFGEELRMERVARGIALEQITAITKISRHHLLALEQESFGQLPGGILNKGIVRGYAGALGLDPQDWTERFLRAYHAAGLAAETENDWTTFAFNVGRSRIERREALEFKVRWLFAVVVFMAVVAACYLMIRFYGVRAGWWSTVLPAHPAFTAMHGAYLSARSWLSHLLS
jgi:cytoskeletal protein RodZ